jgi:phosphomannomutase/phosphoglucomutase
LFFMSDTAEFSVKESYRFEKIFFNKPEVAAWSEVGKCSEVDVSDLYLRSVLEHVDLRKISSSDFKVVVDPGNGASAVVCDRIFQAAGVEVVVINGEPDGMFPCRDPYPRPEILGELVREVNESGADIGSATDADGDRAIFVDDESKALWGDISGCVFVKDILMKHGSGVVVAPINSSQLIEWVCNVYNGEILYTKVGPPNIVSTLKGVKALFGVEETGKNIWPEALLYGDWILATLKMLEIMAKEQKSLSELVQEFPRFHMKKKAFYCPDTLKNAVMMDALEEWKKREEEAEVVTIDGAKIIYPDGSWMLLRPSGTEPVFRVYVESQDFTRVKELMKVGSDLINDSLLRARAC